MPGNTTEAVSTADSAISTVITTEVNTLVPRRLTQGPRTARSLHSMQQEHRGGRQQHARQRLDALDDEAERGVRG